MQKTKYENKRTKKEAIAIQFIKVDKKDIHAPHQQVLNFRINNTTFS